MVVVGPPGAPFLAGGFDSFLLLGVAEAPLDFFFFFFFFFYFFYFFIFFYFLARCQR